MTKNNSFAALVALSLFAPPPDLPAQEQLSREGLVACANANVAECKFRLGIFKRAEGSFAEAKLLLEQAIQLGYTPAEKALLDLLRAESSERKPAPGSSSPLLTATSIQAQATPSAPFNPSNAPPTKTSQPTPTNEVATGNEKFSKCLKATFSREIRGVTTHFSLDWRPNTYSQVSQGETNQTYTFCYTRYGTPGSGMFAGKTFIGLLQLDHDVLAGEYKNPDGTKTKFFFVPMTDWEPIHGSMAKKWGLKDGIALLQVMPNVGKRPGGQIIELEGRSEPTAIPR